MKPLVVLDLSWIRSQPCDHLSNKCWYVIPDGLLGEVVNSNDVPGQAHKLARLIEFNHGHIFLGHSWKAISDQEVCADRPAHASWILNHQSTKSLFECLRQNELEAWQLGLGAARLSETNQRNEAKRAHFVELCTEFGQWINEHDSSWRGAMADPGVRKEWIQRPSLVSTACGTLFPEFKSEEWQGRLNRFPDAFSVGRWVRIVACSALKQSIGHTHRLENDWDDAQYAFLASYACELRTLDKRLAEMVRIIFPMVKVPG